MKRTMIAMLLSLAAVATALAQSAQQKPEAKEKEEKPAVNVTVDQILDKYIQAIGGKAAIEKITSSIQKGTFEIPAMGLKASVEAYSKAPNRQLEIVDLGGYGTSQMGYDGTNAWAQDPQTGLRDIKGVELASLKRKYEFHRELKFKEQYAKLEVKGKEKVGNGEAYVIEATPAEGSAEKFFFDTQSGLLVRNDSEEEGPQGKIPVKTYLEDYKEVDGLKVPFTTRQETPFGNIVVTLTEIKHNVPIDDAKFNKPAAK
jgi:zinc protease